MEEAALARQLPAKRKTLTYELVILTATGKFKLYLAVGMVDEGRPLEIWLDCAKEGTMLREFMHAWASLFSIALQSGVPLPRLVNLYKNWRFEPCGLVEGFEKVPSCESVLSLVVSVLEAEFPDAVAPDQKNIVPMARRGE